MLDQRIVLKRDITVSQFSQKQFKKIFRDAGLLDEVVIGVARNKDHTKKLAADIADEISAIIEEDPDFKRRVLEASILSPKLEREVLKKIREKIR